MKKIVIVCILFDNVFSKNIFKNILVIDKGDEFSKKSSWSYKF